MSIDIAVVPVAGLGTRLLPATKSQPKEMLPVGRKPVVQYVVEELTRVGMQRLLFVTGPGKASIENHFDLDSDLIQTLRESGKEELLGELEFERAPVQYFYTRQRQALGLGHAVLCAESFVGANPFVVALGDSIIGLHAQSDVVRRMTRCFEERHAAAVIAFEEVPAADVSHYGIAAPRNGAGEVFEIEDLVEKPSTGRGAEQPGDRRPLRPVARHLRGAAGDAAGQGRRDPADRRHPGDDPARRAGVRRSASAPARRATTSATSNPTSARSWSSRWPTGGSAPSLRRHLEHLLDAAHT